MNEVHRLGVWVHGGLSALHGLGLLYNLRRRNWFDVACHAAWLAYDLRSAVHHHRESM